MFCMVVCWWCVCVCVCVCVCACMPEQERERERSGVDLKMGLLHVVLEWVASARVYV